MASHSESRTLTFKATAAISRGHAVKFGADRMTVTKATAASDLLIGVAQTAPTTAGDLVEVAINGGGAIGLAGGSISAGNKLTVHTDGTLLASTTANDQVVGVAMEDAVAGDLFAMEVALSNY